MQNPVVICSLCKIPIWGLVKKVENGDLISADLFQDVGYGSPKNGDAIRCPVCSVNASALSILPDGSVLMVERFW